MFCSGIWAKIRLNEEQTLITEKEFLFGHLGAKVYIKGSHKLGKYTEQHSINVISILARHFGFQSMEVPPSV